MFEGGGGRRRRGKEWDWGETDSWLLSYLHLSHMQHLSVPDYRGNSCSIKWLSDRQFYYRSLFNPLPYGIRCLYVVAAVFDYGFTLRARAGTQLRDARLLSYAIYRNDHDTIIQHGREEEAIAEAKDSGHEKTVS